MDIQVLNHFMTEQLSGSDTPLVVHKEDQEAFAQLFEQEIAAKEEESKAVPIFKGMDEEEEAEFHLPVMFLTEYKNEVSKEHALEEAISKVKELQEHQELLVQELESDLSRMEGPIVNTDIEFIEEETQLEAVVKAVAQEVDVQKALQVVFEQETSDSQMIPETFSSEMIDSITSRLNRDQVIQNKSLTKEDIQLIIQEFIRTVDIDEIETTPTPLNNDSSVVKEKSMVLNTLQTHQYESKQPISHLRSLSYIDSDTDWTAVSSEEKERLIELLDTDISNTRPTINQREFKQIGQLLSEKNVSSFSKAYAAEPENQEQVASKDVQESELVQANTLDLSRVGSSTLSKQPSEVPVLNQSETIQRIQEIVTERVQESNQSEAILTRIQLTPEKLGEIEIQLEWKNNQFVGRMLVTSNETKEWMESQLREFSRGVTQLQHIDARRIEVQVITPTEHTEKSAFQFSAGAQGEHQHPQGNAQENTGSFIPEGNKKGYKVTETTEPKTKRADDNESGRLSLLV